VQGGLGWTFNEPVATDVCSAVTVEVINTVTNTIDGNTLVATRTWQATDACGNASTCQQAITVSLSSFPVQTPVDLGSATTFGVLAGSTVVSTGATTVNGDLGVSPGTTLTGTPTVNGTTYLGDATAAEAQIDLTAAYDDVAGRTLGAITVTGDLGGQTLSPGLYTSTSSLEISSGNLILDAHGDTNAVFIFQIDASLTTTSGIQVILTGGAQPSNIFWQVGDSATLGTNTVFEGTILADQSITLMNGATLDGRALAVNGTVTLDANTITIPIATPGIVLQSAAVAVGPYTDAVGQSVNSTAKVITVPRSGNMQYYRIRSNTALRITGIAISGNNVVLTFN